MAQGKLKAKSQVPNQKKKQKGKAFTRRPSEFQSVYILHAHMILAKNRLLPFISDAPIQAKKNKFGEQQKLKQLVSKNVNKSVEQEIRQRATEGQMNLSKAQQAVAKFHKEKGPEATASTSQ